MEIIVLGTSTNTARISPAFLFFLSYFFFFFDRLVSTYYKKHKLKLHSYFHFWRFFTHLNLVCTAVFHRAKIDLSFIKRFTNQAFPNWYWLFCFPSGLTIYKVGSVMFIIFYLDGFLRTIFGKLHSLDSFTTELAHHNWQTLAIGQNQIQSFKT